MRLLRRLAAIALVAAASSAALPAHAQDLEPRNYVNTPVGINFLVAGYAYATGGFSTDASIALDDAEIDTHLALVAYARSLDIFGKSGKIDVILPYGWLSGSATLDGVDYEREVDGLGDPRVRVGINLFGAPAMSLEEWKGYRQNVIFGASFQTSIPLGQYDDERLVNLGTNRWFFKPELGLSKAWDRFIFELSASATIFTDNDDYFGGHHREQNPLYAVQGHFVYPFWRGAWLALDAVWYAGGRTSVDGIEREDLQQSTRLGGTIAIPVGVHHSIKLYASTATATQAGTDFDQFGVAWQVRWGGGL